MLAHFPVPAMKHPDPMFHTDGDYPVTADSIARAKAAQAAARQEVFEKTGMAVGADGKILTYGEQWERATAIGELALIVNRFGAPKVQKWLKSIISISPVDHVDEIAQTVEEQ